MTNAKETKIIFGNIDRLWFMASKLPPEDSEIVHTLCFDRGILVEDVNKCGGIVSNNHMRIIRELGMRADSLLSRLEKVN